MNKKQFIYSNLLAWGLVILLVGNYVFGWTGPSKNPPQDNVSIEAGVTPAGDSGQIQFNESNNLGADSSLFWDIANKRLGIGTSSPKTKLDVSGAIKVGSETTCNSSTEGAIRYNTTSKQIEVCNGEGWLFFISVPPFKECGDPITFTYRRSFVTYGTIQ